jgi:hypothetical protein
MEQLECKYRIAKNGNLYRIEEYRRSLFDWRKKWRVVWISGVGSIFRDFFTVLGYYDKLVARYEERQRIYKKHGEWKEIV